MKDPFIRKLFESSNPGRDLAHALEFKENPDGTIGAPSSRSPNVHGTLRAVYALWWLKEDMDDDDGNKKCVIL